MANTPNASLADRLANLLSRARYDGGLSQSELAKELGVSKRTIQKWEDGTTAPNFLQILHWFRALGINPMPALQSYLYPNIFDGISGKDSDDEIRNALHTRIDSMSPGEIRSLLFILYGNHGSSPYAVMQEAVANLQTPLANRQQVAVMIKNNYEASKAMGTINCPDNIQPDMDAFNTALQQATVAYYNNLASYVGIDLDDSDSSLSL